MSILRTASLAGAALMANHSFTASAAAVTATDQCIHQFKTDHFKPTKSRLVDAELQMEWVRSGGHPSMVMREDVAIYELVHGRTAADKRNDARWEIYLPTRCSKNPNLDPTRPVG